RRPKIAHHGARDADADQRRQPTSCAREAGIRKDDRKAGRRGLGLIKWRLTPTTSPGAAWFRRGSRSSAGHAEDQDTSSIHLEVTATPTTSVALSEPNTC